MSKILFLTRKEHVNPAINFKLKERLDCDFIPINARDALFHIKQNNVELAVIFLSRLSSEEEIEVNKFLMNSEEIPVVLAGERTELSKYFNKTKANVMRYIATPVLLSECVNQIQKCVNKIEGIDDEEISSQEVVEAAPKKILIIDDDIVMLRTISNWLTDLFTVSVAKSGAAGLQYLAKETPDLILLDYEMPVCDGLQTLQMIRSEENLKEIPVFFLTAVDDIGQVKKALELKPQGYILKSKGADYLISKIENYF